MDYLKIYEKFKNKKEIADYINDVCLLRNYYQTRQFSQMQNHICSMTAKYFTETVIWNIANSQAPKTYEQAYINAEKFLQMQGAMLIAKNIEDYERHLTDDEVSFLESAINSTR